MTPSIVDSLVLPSDYADLTNEELCERYLLPMIVSLRRVSGHKTEADHVHLRLTCQPTFDWMYENDN